MRELLRKASFRRLFSALFISSVGRWFNFVAVSVLVYQLTDSALSVVLTIVAKRLPTAFFGLPAGYVADHYHKRWIMVICDLISAAAVVPILLVQKADDIWIIYISYFILASATTFYETARRASVLEIVPHELVQPAQTFFNSAHNMTMFFSAALGGFLYPIIGIKSLILIDAITFLISAGLISSLRQIGKTIHPQNSYSFREKLWGGFHKIRTVPQLKTMFTYNMATTFSFCAYSLIMTVYPLKLFHMGASGVGIFNSLFGLGTIIGAFISAKLTVQFKDRLEKIPPIFVLLCGFAFVAMSLTSSPQLGMILFLLSVILYICFDLTQENILIAVTEKEYVGRVFAFEYASIIVLFSIFNLGYGKMADWLPVNTIGIVGGIFLILFPFLFSLLKGTKKEALLAREELS